MSSDEGFPEYEVHFQFLEPPSQAQVIIFKASLILESGKLNWVIELDYGHINSSSSAIAQSAVKVLDAYIWAIDELVTSAARTVDPSRYCSMRMSEALNILKFSEQKFDIKASGCAVSHHKVISRIQAKIAGKFGTRTWADEEIQNNMIR